MEDSKLIKQKGKKKKKKASACQKVMLNVATEHKYVYLCTHVCVFVYIDIYIAVKESQILIIEVFRKLANQSSFKI